MKLSRVSTLVLAFAAVLLFAGSVSAVPFTVIRIGDIDGLGYGVGAGYLAANGGPANVDGVDPLGNGDFIPDLNTNGILATGQGDDFDNRSAAEIAGSYVEGSGFSAAGGSMGSEFTDIALSTSFDATFPPPNNFPTPPSATRPNQPGFIFDFMVGGGDIVSGQQIFLNVIFGDYDVVPAEVQVTRADGVVITLPVVRQPGGQDGLIQAAFSTLTFADVFTASGADWHGYLEVDFVAPNEPYTAFDFAELSTEPILPDYEFGIDIKPMSCPNPLNVKEWMIRPEASRGEGPVVPVAVLGSDELDVMTIDVSSILFEGITPIAHSYEDVAGAVGPDPEECECTTAGPDGFIDLSLKFDKMELIAALDLDSAANGDVIMLGMSGLLLDGSTWVGSDCMILRISKGGKGQTPTSTDGRIAAEAMVTSFDNFPNPFNAQTVIRYTLGDGSEVDLSVYNALGQRVTTLVAAHQSAGEHQVTWNATNDAGQAVATGMYFYRLQVGATVVTRQMVLLK